MPAKKILPEEPKTVLTIDTKKRTCQWEKGKNESVANFSRKENQITQGKISN